MSDLVAVEERDFAFQNRLQTFSVVNKGHIDIREFFADAFILIERKINPILDELYIVKVSACLCAIFEKSSMTENGEKMETQTIYIHTKTEIVDFETDLKEFYDEFVVSHILKKK